MTSRNYSELTIKKLYGLSGNQCAFPECHQELITTDKKINVSDICHIEGGEKNSPRCNPSLELKQLNDYENLILMCKTHNKLIDSDVLIYTVEYLKKLKSEHEQKNIGKKYDISDEMVEKIIAEQSIQTNVNASSGNQNITQTGDIHIHHGITSIGDTEELIKDLFEQNFPKLMDVAEAVARERIDQYNKAFFERAKLKLDESDITKFSEPDIQYVLTSSIKQAARKDEPELRENLAHLLVERIKNSDDDLRRIVYNEAIETIGKLTRDGLKIITLCFILKYANWRDADSYERLNELIKNQISPLFDFKNTLAEFQHIVYTGCGELGIGEWSYEENIVSEYQLEPMIISKSAVLAQNFPPMVISELFSEMDEENYLFNATDEQVLEDYLSKITVPDTVSNSIRTLFHHSKNESKIKVFDTIKGFEMIQKTSTIMRETSLRHLTLTSVGIAVGAMYYERLTGEMTDISIWIN